jgi:hypothetical protein
MNYRTATLTIAIICFVAGATGAQRKTTHPVNALLDPNQPAVTISFVRIANLEPIYASDGREYVLFQVRNNTRWDIWLQMSGVPTKAYGDASLFYTVAEPKTGTIRRRETCHVCSVNPVGPGHVVTFPIPRQLVTKDAFLRVEYSFAWEEHRENASGSVSTHVVEFYFNSLPKTVFDT